MENHEELVRSRAAKKVKELSGFYKHLIAFIVVNVGLIGIDCWKMEAGEVFWSLDTFATSLIWGFFLALHALAVFLNHIVFGSRWESRTIQKLMERKESNTWE